MDKPAVAHGRIMNAMCIAFPAFLTGLISGLHVVLRHLPNSLGASVWKRWVSPELQRGAASVATSLFGCGFRI
jgi:hypothetical protein